MRLVADDDQTYRYLVDLVSDLAQTDAAGGRAFRLRAAFNRLSDRVLFPTVFTPDKLLRAL